MIAFADQDLVGVPGQRLAFRSVAPADEGATRAPRSERKVLEAQDFLDNWARLGRAHDSRLPAPRFVWLDRMATSSCRDEQFTRRCIRSRRRRSRASPRSRRARCAGRRRRRRRTRRRERVGLGRAAGRLARGARRSSRRAGDREVLLGELVALGRIGMTALGHRTRASTIWWARQQGPAAGIASQRAAWSR